MNNTGRPLVDTNGNEVVANKYYIIRAIGSNARDSGNIDGGTFLIKKVSPASNDANDPPWLRNNKVAFFDHQGQELSLDNTTSTFTPVEPSSFLTLPSWSFPSMPSIFSTSKTGGKRTRRPKRKRSRKTKLIRK
jgi:hypothetical protein